MAEERLTPQEEFLRSWCPDPFAAEPMGALIESVWYTPESDDVPAPVISVQTPGPKALMHIWLNIDGPQIDWGWRVHRTAVRVWPPEGDVS